jgi:hypothetical protein
LPILFALFVVGILLAQIRSLEPRADGKVVKEDMDAQLKELLGEKSADDEKPLQRKKEKKPRGGTKAEVNTLFVCHFWGCRTI